MGGRYFAKRTDPIALPSASDVSGVAVASNVAATATGLTLDSGATGGQVPTGPVITVFQTSSATQSTNAASAVSSGKSISMGVVIGSCIGAFVFVTALIIFGVWFYRRYSESLRRQALSRSSLKHRLQGDQQRRRRWNKLEDEEDKWEGMNQTQTKEVVDQVVPMEKLTMFKRAASVRTAYTQKSVDDHPLTYPQSFAPFDTNLVRTLSADPTIVPQSQSSEANSIKAQNPSALSPSSNSLNVAIPTPQATVLQSHKWESAEVVQYDGQSAEVVESSAQDKEVKRSMHNPFFGSQEYSRAKSDSRSDEKSLNVKGKELAHNSMSSSLLSLDPFEALAAQLPKPFVHHQPTDSSTSSQSKTRAMQTLMGALELSEDEVRDRLRVASMQPSEVSEYQTPLDEEFVNRKPY
jgi:hypothetical protein